MAGTEVTVTAIAADGYEFDHWEGDLTGSDNPVSIEMGGNKTITAIFSAYFGLSVEVEPTGGGTVTLEPSQPAEGYVAGTEVTVTAIAADGYRFDHWSGALSGSENPTTLIMVSGKEVAANFTKPFPWWGMMLAGVTGGALISLAFYLLVIRRWRRTAKEKDIERQEV
ncbi:MAG: hypothetical protein ISS53_01775 [Dehalococcoidia bacterium]|nr:hypothetical protein [Dehalococcoidia bacterium]